MVLLNLFTHAQVQHHPFLNFGAPHSVAENSYRSTVGSFAV